jgi:hypothetical protein
MTNKKSKSIYRYLPIHVYFPPQKKYDDTASPVFIWKNEYEIIYRINNNNNNTDSYQLHFRIHPLWLHLRLRDEEGLASSIDEEGWIGVHVPAGRRFSKPQHIDTLKAFLRTLAHLSQNPGTYLCMDTMTRVLCVRRDGDEDQDIEQNIYRLRDITNQSKL